MSSLDYLELCRLCLVKDNVSLPIFEDEGDERQIYFKISSCLPVKVLREDKLPKKICDECGYKVELLYQFWNTSVNAEKQLLQWLGEVGGLEDKQDFVTEVLDPSVLKQDRSGNTRLDGNVLQVSGQGNIDINMIDNMSIITIPAGSEQQFTTVPMDTSVVQAVAGPSTQVTHEQLVQSQADVSQIVGEESEEDNYDDGCDNDDGMAVKEETEEDHNEQSTFANVSLPCDEAGPSGLQQSELTAQTADGDHKSGCLEEVVKEEVVETSTNDNVETPVKPKTSIMLITYENGKPSSYKLVPVKRASEVKNLPCDECGLTFVSELRLKYHRFTHDPLGQKQKQARALKRANSTSQEDEGATAKSRTTSSEPGIKDKPKNVLYICPSCDFNTMRRDIMITHFTSTHCFKSNSKKRLIEKIKEVQQLNDVTEDTDEVKEKDVEKEVVEQEEEEKEEEEGKVSAEQVCLKCERCGFEGQDEDDLDFHTCVPADEKAEATFSCHLCTYEGLTSMGLQSHITRKHRPRNIGQTTRNYNCEYCEYVTTNRRTMYSHRRKHQAAVSAVKSTKSSKPKPGVNFFCDECNFAARTKSTLYLHIQRQHREPDQSESTEPLPKPPGPKPNKKQTLYTCDQCDYTNKNKYEMKVHVIRKHTNEFNYACEICGKKYKIRGDLTNHIRFQHREQPIICDVCGKTCGNSNSLYVHQKFAHYKAEFECHICHRRMVSQANLDEHVLKQHEQHENAVCDECGKTFTRHSRLKIHMRTHTGDKPYSCPICGKPFARKTALRQHLLTHTGKRPYLCDICGKAFTQKPGLISHRKSHPGNHPPLPRFTIEHVISDLLTKD